MIHWLLGFAGRFYVLALARILTGEHPDWDRAEVRRLAQREVDAIGKSIEAHFDYQDRERRILSDRLTRRFDLGMAMNESANRAIAEKAEVMRNYPTPQQQAALKLQQETLLERLKKP